MIQHEELMRRTEWVLRRNERMLLAEGQIDVNFYFWRGTGALLYRWSMGEMSDWMNDAGLKEYLFCMLRFGVEQCGYDCFISATDTFQFKTNAKGVALGLEGLRKLKDDRFKTLVAQGYGDVVEAVNVTGQTPEVAYSMARPYFRDALNPDRIFKFGEVDKFGMMPMESGERTYAGRTKIFGSFSEPEMEKAYLQLKKQMQREGCFDQLGKIMESATTLVNIQVEEP